MNFNLVRHHDDGTQTSGDYEISLDLVHVGLRIPADDESKEWEFTYVSPSATPPTIIARLVDSHRDW
jgi:hypothetical protein